MGNIETTPRSKKYCCAFVCLFVFVKPKFEMFNLFAFYFYEFFFSSLYHKVKLWTRLNVWVMLESIWTHVFFLFLLWPIWDHAYHFILFLIILNPTFLQFKNPLGLDTFKFLFFFLWKKMMVHLVEFIMNKSYKPQIFVLLLCVSVNALTLWAKGKVPN